MDPVVVVLASVFLAFALVDTWRRRKEQKLPRKHRWFASKRVPHLSNEEFATELDDLLNKRIPSLDIQPDRNPPKGKE